MLRTQIAPIKMVGFDPDGELFRPQPLFQGDLEDIKQPYSIVVDQMDLTSLDIDGVGDTAEIGSFRAEVVGMTSGIRSIVSSPFVFTSLPNALAHLNSPIAAADDNPVDPPAITDADRISFVLVQAQPG